MLDLMLGGEEQGMLVKMSFEHSLRSISKWESKHQKPFYSDGPKTPEETASYVECMALTEDSPGNWADLIAPDDFVKITEYINGSQTATTFGLEVEEKTSQRERVTSELMYYWLVQFRIPLEVQDWHVTRMMALIKIAGIKQSKPKKMDRRQVAEQYRKLNEQRRREMGTDG